MKKLKLNPSTKRAKLQEYNEKSEQEFMKEVLIPLFENMGFETTYNHGPNEEGKDFVLKKRGDFGSDEFTAVIVKTGDISNTSKNKEKNTLDEIKRQLKQAQDMPLNEFDGIGKFPLKIIIVISGRISQSVRKEFYNNKELTSKNIELIPNEKLILLLDKHYPVFFDFKLPTMANYLNELVSHIKNITSIDSQFSSYIDHLNLYCRKNEKKLQSFSLLKKKAESIFSKGKSYWIQGGTGSGKTFTIYKLAEKSLHLLSNKNMKKPRLDDLEKLILPIYARASDIKYDESKSNLSDFLYDLAKKYSRSISLDNIKKWLQSYHILLTIDGIGTKTRTKTYQFNNGL